jgi:hypothetical protein
MIRINMNTPESIQPWYTQFWPWFLISISVLTVISGVSMFLIANHKPDGVVVDDYYKTGLAINKTLARDERARALGLQAVGHIDPTNKQVIVELHGQITAKKLRLALTHPTAAQQDIVIPLQATNQKNQYTGQLPELPQEKRYILLEPEDKAWRLTGNALFPDTVQWSLSPGL